MVQEQNNENLADTISTKTAKKLYRIMLLNKAVEDIPEKQEKNIYHIKVEKILNNYNFLKEYLEDSNEKIFSLDEEMRQSKEKSKALYIYTGKILKKYIEILNVNSNELSKQKASAVSCIYIQGMSKEEFIKSNPDIFSTNSSKTNKEKLRRIINAIINDLAKYFYRRMCLLIKNAEIALIFLICSRKRG